MGDGIITDIYFLLYNEHSIFNNQSKHLMEIACLLCASNANIRSHITAWLKYQHQRNYRGHICLIMTTEKYLSYVHNYSAAISLGIHLVCSCDKQHHKECDPNIRKYISSVFLA